MGDANPFFFKKEQYNRNINMMQHWMDDQVAHLKIMTGMDEAECRKFIGNKIRPAKVENGQVVDPGGVFAFKDPGIRYLERNIDTGDRTEEVSTLSNYLAEIVHCKDIVAPTFTTYHPPSTRKSPLVGFQQRNVKTRSTAKKAMFSAEMELDKIDKELKNPGISPETRADLERQRPLVEFQYNFKKSEQTGRKLSNNAVSGAHVNAHNPLYNKTAHSTLTSNCRQTAAYGNTNNERFLAGNRHYWSDQITRNNIISIVNHTDYERLQSTMDLYQLHYPTVDETMQTIKYSTDLYWWNEVSMLKLRHLVDRLTPIQRAAFVYNGDMYHLRKFNEGFVRQFMTRLIEYVDTPDPTPDETIHSYPEAYHSLAQQICCSFMLGKKINDIKKEQPANYAIFATVVKNVANVLNDYFPMIRTFWVTDNLPASIAMLPFSLRRVVLASDTDSTIFTVQEWVDWYVGEVNFGETANAISTAMIFLTSQTIIHVLATMSANAGVERDRTFQISMKNEFKFDDFVLTQLGKHYFARISMQEGNLFSKFKTEIKGVHLKSSNVPKEIVKKAEAMMIDIMDQIHVNGKISALEKATEVADIERSIETSIRKGDFKYLKISRINVSEAYKQGAEASNYLQYSLWNEVFAKKYGMVGAPPYRVIVVSVDLDSKAKMNAWINSLEDKEMGQAMLKWLAENKPAHSLSTLMIPATIVSANGIPDEIMQAMNVRKIIHKATAMFYLILETLGVYINHTDLQHLAMDYY